jgi:glycosyltransferase involved in cell wall biosynthesis
MNILMISDVYFPRVNGVSTSIATFRRSLAALGHDSTLIAPDYAVPAEDDAGIVRIPSRYLVLDPEDRILKAGEILALERRLAGARFDLLHIQTPFIAHHVGVKLARRLGIPAVETYHTYFEEYLYHYVPFLPKPLLKFMARALTRRQCNRLGAVIVPSRAMHEVLHGYGVRAPVSVIPTGIEPGDLPTGSRERFCTAHGIDPSRPMLVHIGRVAHEKNIAFLLDVLTEVRRVVPGILLVIAGEGPALLHLRRRALDLELERHVRFLGYLKRGPALSDCYCAGDAFIFASATETQGLVLLEAMTLGVPVVSTAVMGTKDILAAGKGALVAGETVADFAGKVIRLLGDPRLRARLGAEARAHAAGWSAEAMARRLVEFYRQVIELRYCASTGQEADSPSASEVTDR